MSNAVAIHIIEQPIRIVIEENTSVIQIVSRDKIKTIEIGNVIGNGSGLTVPQVEAIVTAAINAYKSVVDSNSNGIIDSAEKLLTRSPDNQLWEVVVDNDGSMFTNRIT